MLTSQHPHFDLETLLLFNKRHFILTLRTVDVTDIMVTRSDAQMFPAQHPELHVEAFLLSQRALELTLLLIDLAPYRRWR